MKPQLPTVTLCIIDCINAHKAIKVLEHNKKMCDFGAVKLLTSIPVEYEHATRIMPLNSLVAYSVFMMKELYKYIETSHVQIIQNDGWILNPSAWKEEWLDLDFCGPLFMQVDKCGSGGFSLRSKRIMEAVSATLPEWDGTDKHAHELQRNIPMYEDGMLSLTQFAKGFKIATNEQAADYAQGGNRNPAYFREFSYGFHRTHQVIDFSTGRIDSSDPTRDITNSYDHIIEIL